VGEVVTASPVIANGVLCIQAGGLFALDPANGKIMWRAALGTSIQSVPVLTSDGIYIASLSGEIYALR
jgi:outer membrane protein assembly factor BamB